MSTDRTSCTAFVVLRQIFLFFLFYLYETRLYNAFCEEVETVYQLVIPAAKQKPFHPAVTCHSSRKAGNKPAGEAAETDAKNNNRQLKAVNVSETPLPDVIKSSGPAFRFRQASCRASTPEKMLDLAFTGNEVVFDVAKTALHGIQDAVTETAASLGPPDDTNDISVTKELGAPPLLERSGALPRQNDVVVKPTLGHFLLAAHACTLAGLQAVYKGDLKDFKEDAIANADAVTPVGGMLLRDYVLQ
eukprot:2639908-Rhodomonas_salina.3